MIINQISEILDSDSSIAPFKSEIIQDNDHGKIPVKHGLSLLTVVVESNK